MPKLNFRPFILVVISLLLTVAIVISWQVPVLPLEFTPPDRGAPENLIGAGSRFSDTTRGNLNRIPRAVEIVVNGEPLECPFTALVPQGRWGNYGLTIDPSPTFFIHLPAVENAELSFSLSESLSSTGETMEDESEPIYESRSRVSSPDTTFGISLPKYASPLEIGKAYTWRVQLDTDPDNTQDEVYVLEGRIERFEPTEAFAQELNRATPEEKVELYAKASLWYDALNALASLRQTYPANPRLVTDWVELLKSVGLDEIAEKTLI